MGDMQGDIKQDVDIVSRALSVSTLLVDVI